MKIFDQKFIYLSKLNLLQYISFEQNNLTVIFGEMLQYFSKDNFCLQRYLTMHFCD